MIPTTTFQGLDEALGDLRRAIDALPDDGIKKQLQRRYDRLRSVRDALGGQREAFPWLPLLALLLGASILVLTLFLLLKRDR